jgi:hypothetical protein
MELVLRNLEDMNERKLDLIYDAFNAYIKSIREMDKVLDSVYPISIITVSSASSDSSNSTVNIP